jgi:hypothetical protein
MADESDVGLFSVGSVSGTGGGLMSCQKERISKSELSTLVFVGAARVFGFFISMLGFTEFLSSFLQSMLVATVFLVNVVISVSIKPICCLHYVSVPTPQRRGCVCIGKTSRLITLVRDMPLVYKLNSCNIPGFHFIVSCYSSDHGFLLEPKLAAKYKTCIIQLVGCGRGTDKYALAIR